MKALVVAFAVVVSVSTSAVAGASGVILTEGEIEQMFSHGPWPPPQRRDASNRVSGEPSAIAFGATLFSNTVLSRDGEMSCASCHDPERAFTEPKPRSMGRRLLDRNAPTLYNLSTHRWFGWDGSADNIWARSLSPILNPDELGHDFESLQAALIASEFAADYSALFGDPAQEPPIDTAVNIAKALAAYLETLATDETPFDRFRTALKMGDLRAAATYPAAAQRGLKLFLGRGNCTLCHAGPAFTNGEFHDAGVPYFLDANRVDTGRHGGLKALFASPFTLDGPHSDDPAKSGAWAVRSVREQHTDFGTFRVPGLRNVAETAPYMHNGSLPDLEAVVRHYDEIDVERLHVDGEAILRPLELTNGEVSDLVAFLESLSDSAE